MELWTVRWSVCVWGGTRKVSLEALLALFSAQNWMRSSTFPMHLDLGPTCKAAASV